MTEIEVAAYGPSAAAILDPGFFRGPLLEDHGDELAWCDRLRVSLRVDGDTPLVSVLDMAASEFGISLGPALARSDPSVGKVVAGVTFYRPVDDVPGVTPGPWSDTVRTVDVNGRLRWQSIEEAEIGDLIRAYERGLLEGDPRRTYFWPMVSQGDAGILFDTWEAIYEGFKYALLVAGAIAAVGQTGEYLTRIIRRLRAGSEIDAEKLDHMLVSPWRVSEMLAVRSFDIEELQRLLGITGEDAQNALQALGFEERDGGEWRPGIGQDARFVSRLGDLLIRENDSRPHNWEAVKEFVKARIEALLRGEEEGRIVWISEWHEKVRGFDFSGIDEDNIDNENESTPDFRVLTVPLENGVDVARLEEELGVAAEEGFDIRATWADQTLDDGTRANLLILVKTGRTQGRRKRWLRFRGWRG